jgi:hypothetical protein
MSLRPEQLPRRSSNIFINYRREDSAGHAGRLFDRLSGRFPERVFMDIDTIEPGIDFVDTIEQAVGCCEVLVVVIGREWLHLADASGHRRLDNPSDFVRLEIAAALERNIRIIPVLVEDAVMPRPEELPPDLVKLTRRNAIELSDVRWAFDMDRLIQAIEGVLQEKAPSALLPVVKIPDVPPPSEPVPAPVSARPRGWLTLSVLVLLVMAGWIGWSLASQPIPQETEEMVALVSPEIPPLQPPASPEVAERPSGPAASPAAKAMKPGRSKPSQGWVGSLVRKGKGKLKNLRERAR